MTEARFISETLAPLILRRDLPLRIVATVGEIISIDARLQDGQGNERRGSFEELGAFLETYDALLQRTRRAVAASSPDQNWHTLREDLSEIKEQLAAFL